MFDGGFSATSLAVFTALAPAGAVAFACLAAFLLVNRSQSRDRRDVLGAPSFHSSRYCLGWIHRVGYAFGYAGERVARY